MSRAVLDKNRRKAGENIKKYHKKKTKQPKC